MSLKDLYKDYNINSYDDLENALKKAKAFDIIKKKNVRLWQLQVSTNLESYNYHCLEEEELTQDEFNLIKEKRDMLGLAIISTILLGLLILLFLISGFDLDMTILEMIIQIAILGILALAITTIWILYKR